MIFRAFQLLHHVPSESLVTRAFGSQSASSRQSPLGRCCRLLPCHRRNIEFDAFSCSFQPGVSASRHSVSRLHLGVSALGLVTGLFRFAPDSRFDSTAHHPRGSCRLVWLVRRNLECVHLPTQLPARRLAERRTNTTQIFSDICIRRHRPRSFKTLPSNRRYRTSSTDRHSCFHTSSLRLLTW